ncbi:membrane protein [Lysinibacillus contaminans]|uniref:Membrane protein n=1 Tax=Lysinibacillus contaminans TaxID=1293441 RepID=A0ABR5K381_9BACI|nr:ABC transporter permease [Lysinibacillus contaminans]KOS69219.1 membrane protein [Lysinibacillus contaminans]
MNNFAVLSKKEFDQMIRELKIIWLPVVFMLLGLMQPISMYYLPVILEKLGGVEGILIDPTMARPDGSEVLASTLGSQFDQLGIIILVVAAMSVIQAEKVNGMLAFILTRPVSISSYIGSKIMTHYFLAIFSIAIGYAVSYGYTAYLFTSVPIPQAILAFVLYCIWLLFLITLVTMLSTFFNSPAFIALVGIVVLLLCRMTAGLHPLIGALNPAGVSLRATSVLATGSMGDWWEVNIIATLLIILGMALIIHYWIAKKKF